MNFPFNFKTAKMSCKTADFLLYRSLQQPNAAPFLGLLDLSERSATQAISEARDLLSRDP